MSHNGFALTVVPAALSCREVQDPYAPPPLPVVVLIAACALRTSSGDPRGRDR